MNRWWTAAAVAGTSASLGLLPLEYAVAASLAAGALVAGLLDPVWLLALVALAVPFGSEVPVRFGGLGGATDLAIAAAVAVWGIRALAQRREPIWLPGVLLPTGLFVAVLAFSLTLAPHAVPAAKETLKWLQFALMVLAAAHVLGDEHRRRILIGAILLAASVEGAIGWYQFATRGGPEAFFLAGGLLRAYGTFGQPNPFAGYLALVLPLVISLALGQPGRWRLPPAPVAAGLCLAGVLIGGGIAFSFSRGAWIATAVAIAAVLVCHSHRVRIAVVVGMPLLAVVVLGGALDVLPRQVVGRFEIVTRYVSLFDARHAALTSENYAVVERMAIWQAAGAMVAGQPFFGVGAGNFDLSYPAYALRGWPNPPGHAHNAYLTVLAETGIVGAVAHGLMLLGLFIMVGTALRRFRTGGSAPDGYPLALGALGMLMALCVHNLLDNLYVHSIPAHLGLMIGAVAAAVRTDSDTRRGGS